MDGAVTRSAEELSREELHELVWQAPLTKLGPQLGTDGPGLAALCRRRRVPTPPLGYWQKKAVGRAPPTTPLPTSAKAPAETSSTRTAAPVRLRGQRVEPAAKAQPGGTSETARAIEAEDDDGLDSIGAPHLKVRAWLAEHRVTLRERQERIRDAKRRGYGWEYLVLPELTPRDLYRLRASSTLCHAVEAAGAKVKDAKIRGDLTFTVGRRDPECTVAEKLTMGVSRAKGDDAWTAYPRSTNASLGPSGFLRATITTWLPGKQPEWVETQRRRFAELAPIVAAAIIACDARLTEWERERAEQEKRWREQEARRREEQRRREIDDKRWSRF